MMQAPLCSLPFDQLRTADIVLTKSQTFNSRAIQGSTCSTYSHALLMVSPTLAVEATPGQIKEITLSALRKDAKVTPLLLKITLIDELSKLADTAHDKTFYCSELVARAFEVAGAPLSRYKARNVSPGQILKAEALMIVGQIA